MCRKMFRCMKKLLTVALVCAFITFCPGIPPNGTYIPFGSRLKTPQKLTSDLILNNAERLLEGQLVGAEAFAVHKGSLYTGLHGGHVVKVLPNKVLPVVKTGKECAGIHQEHLCGRPLGLKIRGDTLYIADGYFGIFSHIIPDGSGNLDHVLGPNVEVNGKPVKVYNSVEVDKNDIVYFTSSSSEFDINKGLHALFSSGTGRLLKFDPKTKKVTQLLDNILFANGLALSPDEDFLFVVETVGRKVLKYNIKTGNVESILEGLPGLPDNIQPAGGNTFWVSLVSSSDDDYPSITDVFADWPNIRKFLGRVFFLLEFPFKTINQYYPNTFCEMAAYHIGHLGPILAILPEKTTIIRFDGNTGKILDVLHGNNGAVKGISDVAVVGDYLYMGSPANNFIGRVMLPKGKYAQTEEASKFKSDSQAQAIKEAEEAKARKAAQEAMAKRAAAEEAQAKKAAEEAQAKKAAEAAQAKKAAEAAQAKKAAEAAQAKKAAEAAQAKKAAEEAQAKKAAEEAEAKKAAEAQAKKASEEAEAKKMAEEAKAKKAAEEAKKARDAAAKVKADKSKEAGGNKKISDDEIKTNKISENAQQSKVAGDKLKTEL